MMMLMTRLMTIKMMMPDAGENDEADDDTVVHVAAADEIPHWSDGCSPCWLVGNVVQYTIFAINEVLLAQSFPIIDIGRTTETLVGRGIQVISWYTLPYSPRAPWYWP